MPEAVIRHYFDPLQKKFSDSRMDCLVLGCTHFPVLAKSFLAVSGPGVALVDSARTTAGEVEQILISQDLRRRGVGSSEFLATDDVERFARVGSVFLGKTLAPTQIELVDL